MRQEIGILHVYLTKENISRKVERKIQIYFHRIKLNRKNLQYRERLRTHAETLKQKIAALGNRLRRYHTRTKRYRQNNLFANNQRKFFRNLEETTNENAAKPPNPLEMQQYWSGIWSQESKHNADATWIKIEEQDQSNRREMAEIVVKEEDIRATVKRLKNWTTPGIDGIHNYW